MNKLIRSVLFLFMLISSATALAQEILTIESQVTGSKEQPKVISIVPWQEPSEPDYYGEDVTGLDQTELIFKPLDRASFKDEVKYIQALRKK